MPTTPPSMTPGPVNQPQRGVKATFSTRLDAFVTWVCAAVAEFVAMGANVKSNADDAFSSATSASGSAGTATTKAAEALASANSALAASGGTATSTTANTLATGAFTITVQTGKSFVPGMSVKIASTASPTNWLLGDVTAYNSGTGVLTVNSTRVQGAASASAWTASVSAPGIVSDIGYLHVREEQASGTAGGASTATTQHVRTLNTTVGTNSIPGASLASSIVTLPAGTYEVDASAPCYNGGNHKLSIYNDTDLVDLLVGHSSHNSGLLTMSGCKGRFTLASSKNVKLRHYIQFGAATDGLGRATSTGSVEVYSSLQLWKVA